MAPRRRTKTTPQLEEAQTSSGSSSTSSHDEPSQLGNEPHPNPILQDELEHQAEPVQAVDPVEYIRPPNDVPQPTGSTMKEIATRTFVAIANFSAIAFTRTFAAISNISVTAFARTVIAFIRGLHTIMTELLTCLGTLLTELFTFIGTLLTHIIITLAKIVVVLFLVLIVQNLYGRQDLFPEILDKINFKIAGQVTSGVIAGATNLPLNRGGDLPQRSEKRES